MLTTQLVIPDELLALGRWADPICRFPTLWLAFASDGARCLRCIQPGGKFSDGGGLEEGHHGQRNPQPALNLQHAADSAYGVTTECKKVIVEGDWPC